MEVLSKAKYYKVKCNQCASILKFGLYEISQDYYRNSIIKCPVCGETIKVGVYSTDYHLSLSNNVEPIYEE